MPLTLKPETQRKLERLPLVLHDEFPEAATVDVERSVERIARDLLGSARIEDFIPVLVHRYARENLLDRALRI